VFVVGVTVIEVLFDPLSQVYVTAQLAVRTALLPIHTILDELRTEMFGNGKTLIKTLLVSEQLLASLPVTEYINVPGGNTTVLAVIAEVGFQIYELAPVADRVTDPPAQIVVVDEFNVTVGLFTTVTLYVAVLKQLFKSEAITLTTVEVDGIKLFVELFPPLLHVYV
jgi:hypothetical protein